LPNFVVPNTCRTVYHTAAEETKWAPVLNQINQEWGELELSTVLDGTRSVAIQPITIKEYLIALPWAQANGLYVRPIKYVKHFGAFANRYEEGDDMLVTAFCKTKDVMECPYEHLGYPPCCQVWFNRIFSDSPDPMWQWAGETEHPKVALYTNPLLRYTGVRFMSHIPCSADCKPTLEMAAGMAERMHPELRDARLELLRGVIWDSYRGIAIVTAKPFRVVVSSNPTQERYIVRT